MNNTEKFTGKAKKYGAFRPGYPKELFSFLIEEIGILPKSTLADIGAGTGIFTKELAERYHFVYAVEPNADMRRVCRGYMKAYDNYKMVNGSGENTFLANTSIDCIAVAQAFHWMNVEKTKKEFQRILKPNGQVVLVWNSREKEHPFIEENDALFQKLCPNYKGFSGGATDDEDVFTRFFRNGEYKYKQIENYLFLDLEHFLGRNLSASYAPLEGDAMYEVFIKALTELFEKYSKDGVLLFPQYTRVYVGYV